MKLLRHLVVLFVIGILSTSAWSKETINIVRGFGINNHPSAVIKEIMRIANANQNKYEFVLLAKPGAGGTIAIRHVAENPSNSILSISSAFIISHYTQTESTIPGLDNFECLLIQSTDTPVALVSKKYTRVESLLQGPINIVDQGTTSVSGFAAQSLQTYNSNIQRVSTKSQADAMVLLMGEHADAGFVYYGESKTQIDGGNLNLLGITGNHQPSDRKTVLLKKYVPILEKLTVSQGVYAHKDMDLKKRDEIYAILKQAQSSKEVKMLYVTDNSNGLPANFNKSHNKNYFIQEQKFWLNIINQGKQ